MGRVKAMVPDPDWKKKRDMRLVAKERKMSRVIAQLEAEKMAKEQTVPVETLPRLDRPTLSIAIPGSIMENAQSSELRTYLAGQIARAACIFNVDEIIVFDDVGTAKPEDMVNPIFGSDDSDAKVLKRRSCVQMARILQYLECPQYLRRFYFPLHSDLQYAGLLNPLDTPHHLRQTEDFPFREGCVTIQPTKPGRGSLVNVGLFKDVEVDEKLESGLRVTVQLLPQKEGSKKVKGRVVSPQTPEAVTGKFWGYSVRIASSLSDVFSDGPYTRGYDLSIGTSEKGLNVDEVVSEGGFSSYQHALVVLGGLAGLEGALEADSLLQIDDPALLFDHYLNTCPNQGSRTIRTEEALLVTLAVLRPHFQQKKPKS